MEPEELEPIDDFPAASKTDADKIGFLDQTQMGGTFSSPLFNPQVAERLKDSVTANSEPCLAAESTASVQSTESKDTSSFFASKGKKKDHLINNQDVELVEKGLMRKNKLKGDNLRIAISKMIEDAV